MYIIARGKINRIISPTLQMISSLPYWLPAKKMAFTPIRAIQRFSRIFDGIFFSNSLQEIIRFVTSYNMMYRSVDFV